jgi:hypothetical protein
VARFRIAAASIGDCACISRMPHAAKIEFNRLSMRSGTGPIMSLPPLANRIGPGVYRRGGTTVPIEENRVVARRVLDDLVSQGRVELVDHIYARAFEFRDPTAGQTITTHEDMRDLTREHWSQPRSRPPEGQRDRTT